MPVASSSRSYKRTRRAPTSDIEEEDGDGASRRPQLEEDVDMEEEEEQPRRSKKSKKDKKRKAQNDDSDGEAVAEEEEEDVPIPEIEDQPLDRAQAMKVRGIASDWATMRDKLHLPSFNFVTEVAASVAEFTEGEKGEKGLTTIDLLMRELLDTQHELNTHEQVLDDIYQKLSRNEKIPGITDVYRQNVQEKLAAYQAQTSRQKYAKSDHYQKFKQAIYEVHHPDQAMPPVVDMIPREDGDVSDDDDDVQIGGVTQDYKCPLSLTHLVDPLTSKLCGHSYSAAAIKEYLGPARTRTKECPATGCRKHISLDDLREDKELAKRAKQAARRERAREHDSDEDELIE